MPFLAGALSTGGDLATNASNRAEAERNRQFQERMSSTAVQRSVEDYRKAGLNPGLAYDRSASSPSGAQATIGNPVSGGIASANQTRQIQQALRIADEQNEVDKRLKTGQYQAALAAEAQARTQADLNMKNSNLAQQSFNFNTTAQPITQRLMETDAVIKALAIPEAQNKSDFERLMGRGKPGLASAKTFAEILKILF
jgi:hypothetical protein